ncbi:MAG: stage V sporulation T C-terminal domain-containing protein [Anaerotignum faecicola]
MSIAEDAIGRNYFPSKDQKMGEVEGKLAQTAAGFLGKQMEQSRGQSRGF